MELHEREPYNFRINYYVNTWYFILSSGTRNRSSMWYYIWLYGGSMWKFHENWLTIPPDDVSTDDTAWGD